MSATSLDGGAVLCKHGVDATRCETCKGEKAGRIVSLNAGPKPPADLSRQLRELADAVDRGEITSLIAAYPQNDSYEFLYGASLVDALTLSILLHHRCVLRFEA